MSKFKLGDIVSVQGVITGLTPRMPHGSDDPSTYNYAVQLGSQGYVVPCDFGESELTLVHRRPIEAGDRVKWPCNPLTRRYRFGVVLALYKDQAWCADESTGEPSTLPVTDLEHADQ